MNRLKRFALTGLAALTLGLGTSKGLEAATLRVPSEYPTIQQAIDSAANNDSILVASGTYDMIDARNKSLTIKSENGPENTTISCYADNAVSFLGDESVYNYVLDGFMITNPRSLGIYCEGQNSDFTIINNTIQNCNLGVENALAANFIMTNNNIRNSIMAGYFEDTGSSISTVINKNIIFNNGVWGIYLSGYSNQSADFILTRNTITNNGNGEEYSGGMFLSKLYDFRLDHNIVAFNNHFGLKSTEGLLSTIDLQCNDVYGNGLNYAFVPRGNTDINEDPQLCDRTNYNFQLSSRSPCLPQNNSCGLIGALEMGCDLTPTKRTSWGQLKAAYR